MVTSRRQFFTAVSRSMVAGAMDSFAALRARRGDDTTCTSGRKSPPWLRPPGALPEKVFLRTCTRCTACQEACPHGSIRRLGSEFGRGAGTPVIVPQEAPCYLCAEMPCVTACAAGALQRRSPTDVAMGTARLDRERCHVTRGQPCDYCLKHCPLGAAAITRGHGGLPLVHAEACAGCGVCVYLCPAGALHIASTSERKEREIDEHVR